MKNELVLLKGKKILTTSEIIAKETDYEHKAIIQRIYKHEKELKYFGVISPCDVEKTSTKNWKNEKRGRPQKIFYLNKNQTMLLIMFLKNNDKVVKFKFEIAKQFVKMENLLEDIENMTSSTEWQKLRAESKRIRLEETNEIQKMVKYAEENGSENADNYYTHFSKLVWDNLFIIEEGFEKVKNKKDICNDNQLATVIQAENIIKKCINEGLENQTEYHEIYYNTRDKIKLLSSIIDITKIPYYTQLSLI